MCCRCSHSEAEFSNYLHLNTCCRYIHFWGSIFKLFAPENVLQVQQFLRPYFQSICTWTRAAGAAILRPYFQTICTWTPAAGEAILRPYFQTICTWKRAASAAISEAVFSHLNTVVFLSSSVLYFALYSINNVSRITGKYIERRCPLDDPKNIFYGRHLVPETF